MEIGIYRTDKLRQDTTQKLSMVDHHHDCSAGRYYGCPAPSPSTSSTLPSLFSSSPETVVIVHVGIEATLRHILHKEQLKMNTNFVNSCHVLLPFFPLSSPDGLASISEPIHLPYPPKMTNNAFVESYSDLCSLQTSPRFDYPSNQST